LLPDYTIRESARAKRVRFQVSVSDGLVVVIPKGFNRQRIPDLLEEKKHWLARALARVEQHRETMPPRDQPPMTIELPAIGQTWQLDWRATRSHEISISETGTFKLRIAGPIQNVAAWQSTLRQWLIESGRIHLIPWTEALAQELGLPIKRVSIRCQKTRWGSYSTKGTVSLNAQLLFLPRPLARYVLIHELCHAVHPNHSVGFWCLLRTHEPDADRLRVELRNAGRFLPSWLRHGKTTIS